MKMEKICVVGSLNVDLTVTVPRFHQPGESMFANSFHTYTGGKGGNQAVAAARLGADVTMIGCVGADAYAGLYMDALAREHIRQDGIVVTDAAPTGVALIEVDQKGENRIVVCKGANDELTCDAITQKEKYIRESRVCLFQLENPIPSINHAMAIARQSGVKVILDPAPVPQTPITEAIYMLCDYVTPNETELSILTGMPVDTVEEAAEAAMKLIQKGCGAVINKRGAQGALLVTKDGYKLYPGFKVTPVDTTAAGDSFNAGFAVGLTLSLEVGDAIQLANAVGALSTTAEGAQAAMPTLDQAMQLLR